MERARAATSAAAQEIAGPWTLAWGQGGAFPSRGRARVVWLGVADEEQTVSAQAVLVAKLVAAGLPAERRPYRPHLTLARVRGVLSRERAGEVTQALAQVPCPPASVARALVLYRSRLGQGRPSIYEELLVAPIG